MGMALDALKYNALMCRIERGFSTFRQQKIRGHMFKSWLLKARQHATYKRILVPLLFKQYSENVKSTFTHWKRTIFREKFHETMQ
jgi:hypothetical protein